jgi:hypothetical protein
VLLFAEEGLGDTIQFARYVPLLAAQGARVILVAQDALIPLLSQLSGVAQLPPKSADLASLAFDVHCPITSLPLAFGTALHSIPSATPYLPAPSAERVMAWQRRLGAHERMRVGLVWSGNPKHKNDHNRSLPLRMLLPLLDCNATFVSLQKEPRGDDEIVLRERSDIVDLTSYLVDFAETAALLTCVDLVITVDTSVAHLAGALGCPTGSCCPTRRIIAGCSSARTAPGTRRFVCSGKMTAAARQAWSATCVRH